MREAMKVLVVDDVASKMERIVAVVGAASPNATVLQAPDAASAVRLLRDTSFDLMVLDMNLPLRGGESPRADGGTRVIEALKLDTQLRLPAHIVGLTEFDDLKVRFRDELESDLFFLIKFEASSGAWEKQLAARVEHIQRALLGGLESGYGATAVILTALHAVELEAVLNVWPELVRHNEAGDDTVYHKARVSLSGAEHTVVAAAALQMGMAAATALTMKAIETFRPRYICMCGIAAGSAGEFGDVLVATQSWDYGSGKLTRAAGHEGVFSPSPERIPMNEGVRYQIEWFLMREKRLGEALREEWKRAGGASPKKAPAIRMGPMASGAAVIADRTVIDELVALEDRKLVGIEMESYGVMLASRQCRAPKPEAIVCKSVCDFGNAKKNDRYQRYAAFTSAAFARRLLAEALLR